MKKQESFWGGVFSKKILENLWGQKNPEEDSEISLIDPERPPLPPLPMTTPQDLTSQTIQEPVDSLQQQHNESLWEAIRDQKIEEVKLAIAAGAQVGARNREGLHALGLCILEQNVEAFGVIAPLSDLNKKMLDNGHTPLTFCLSKSIRLPFAHRLLDAGCDITSINIITQDSPLNIAIGKNISDVSLLEKLIGEGDLPLRNQRGKNAFQIALSLYSKLPDLWLIELILKKGAQPDLDGALQKTCERGGVHVVKVLLEQGASYQSGNARGQTPLALAAAAGHFDICQVLLEQGANANALDRDLTSPLMEAASHGHEQCMRLLLDHGAPDEPYPGSNLTASSLAERNGFDHLADELRIDETRKNLNHQIPETKRPQTIVRRL